MSEYPGEIPLLLTRTPGKYERLEYILADAQQALRLDTIDQVFDMALQ